ncbi:MAG: CDP-alcohol phosphatidyltransferase family protein [Candidatus Omnitrophica bacterium]|nr:CDP-alcohol phosphatidyltransferase family protein [Candidatus Omnitrophota bacterium]
MNIPNKLTILRIILVPFFVAAILYHKLEAALVIFVLAALTDGFDGYIARVFNQKTHLGAVMDPIADKALIDCAYVSFSLVTDLPAYLHLPLYVPITVLSRDFIILVGISILNSVVGKVDIKPTVLSKITTFFQMATITALLVQFKFSPILWNLTVLFTVVSGIDYIRIGARLVNDKA